MYRKALKEFAKAVGLRLKIDSFDDGSPLYELQSIDREPICVDLDAYGVIESISVYAGGHPDFDQALSDCRLATGLY